MERRVDRSKLKEMEKILATVKSAACAKNMTDKGKNAIISYLHERCQFPSNILSSDCVFVQSIKSGDNYIYTVAIDKSLLNNLWYTILIDCRYFNFHVLKFAPNTYKSWQFKKSTSQPNTHIELKINCDDPKFIDLNSGISLIENAEEYKKIYFAIIDNKPYIESQDYPIRRIIKRGKSNPTISIDEGLEMIMKKLTETPKNREDSKTTSITLDNLDDTQSEIYDLIVNTKQNIFIQGRAGTGKSEIIKLVQKHSNKKILCMAFTGIAAEKIGGTTINSQFKIGPAPIYDPERYKMVDANSPVREADLIIIDEISMLRPDLLDTVDHLCRIAQDKNKPFGGIQMVFIGDLYQLPPISNFNDYRDNKTKEKISKKELKAIMEQKYGSYDHYFFFDAKAYKSADFVFRTLTNVYRQHDEKMLNNLENISKKINIDEAIKYFNSRVVDAPEEYEQKDITILSPWNDIVKDINDKRLNEIQEEERPFPATNQWNDEGEKDKLPAENELKLKVGAFVMFCKNDSSTDKRYVNGTKGKIVEFYKDDCEEKIKVKILSKDNKLFGEDIWIERERWDKLVFVKDPDTHKLDLKNDGKHYFIQFPLKLAYAMTIHKSQGQTLDEAFLKINKSKVWDHGMLYVALSRVKTLDGIYIDREITEHDILCDKRVKEFLGEADDVQQNHNRDIFETKNISDEISEIRENEQDIPLTDNVEKRDTLTLEKISEAENMNIDYQKLDELLRGIGKGTFAACYKVIEQNYNGNRKVIKEAIAKYGIETTGKSYKDGVVISKTSKACTVFKNGWQKEALKLSEGHDKPRDFSANYSENQEIDEGNKQYTDTFCKNASEQSYQEYDDTKEERLKEKERELLAREERLKEKERELIEREKQLNKIGLDKEIQGKLHKEIEQLFNKYNLSVYLKGVPFTNSLKSLHEKYIQTPNPLLAKEINAIYQSFGIDMSLDQRAEAIDDYSYKKILKEKIEKFLEITQNNIQKSKEKRSEVILSV